MLKWCLCWFYDQFCRPLNWYEFRNSNCCLYVMGHHIHIINDNFQNFSCVHISSEDTNPNTYSKRHQVIQSCKLYSILHGQKYVVTQIFHSWSSLGWVSQKQFASTTYMQIADGGSFSFHKWLSLTSFRYICMSYKVHAHDVCLVSKTC